MSKNSLFTKDKKIPKENAPVLGRTGNTVQEPTTSVKLDELYNEIGYIYSILDKMAKDINDFKDDDRSIDNMIGSLGVDVKRLEVENKEQDKRLDNLEQIFKNLEDRLIDDLK